MSIRAALIPDGNRRFSKKKSPTWEIDYFDGILAVCKMIVWMMARPEISELVLFVFSEDNWKRDANFVYDFHRHFFIFLNQVDQNWDLLAGEKTLLEKIDTIPLFEGVREDPEIRKIAALHNNVIPRFHFASTSTENIPAPVSALIRAISERPSRSKQQLTLCYSYSGEADARQAFGGTFLVAPGIDYLVRTGDEKRLSDFCVIQLSHAELIFEPKLWPEISCADFDRYLAEFKQRDRRMGR